MKISLSSGIIFLTFLYSTAVFSSDLTLDGDSIIYDKENHSVKATGNVKAVYSDISVEANTIIYQSDQHTISSDKKSTMYIGPYCLTSDSMRYNLKTKEGSADQVKLFINNIYLTGQKVTILKDQVNLDNTSFSSCPLEHPHYHMTAKNIVLYPELGWVVMYWGTMWLGNIPIVPIPTYVYDIGPKYSHKTVNPAPLPEIGTNPTDGVYLHDRVVWRISGFSYGMLSVDYGSNQGLGAGFEGNYVVNNSNQGNARLNYWGSQGLYGGITHLLSFGQDIPSDSVRHLLYQVLKAPPKKQYELLTDVSVRERINYYRVSLIPNFTVRTNDIDLSHNTKYSLETQIGAIHEEESGVYKTRWKLKGDINNSSNIGGVNANVGLFGDYSLYDSKDPWSQVKGSVLFSKQLMHAISGRVGYEHYFWYYGGTPFLFENYRLFLSDAFKFGTTFTHGISSFSFDFEYNTPSYAPREIDYSLAIGSHCYEFLVKYRAVRNEFSVGVNLLSRSDKNAE